LPRENGGYARPQHTPPQIRAFVRTLRQLLSAEEIVQLVIRLGLLALLIFWTLVLIRPFVPILAWSVVLAVALNPVFERLAKILGGRPKLAATILTVISLAIVIGPATWIGLGAVEGTKDIAEQLTAGEVVVPSPPQAIKSWPLVGPQLYEFWDQASTNLRSVLRQIAPYLKPFAATLLGLAGDAGVGTIKFLVSVAVAGVLFPYGPQLVAAGRGFLSRIVPEQSEHFLDLAGATIRAVSQGVIGVAIIQALLAGIGFKLAGIPGAGLLAFVVLLLSIVQIGGTIVILPVHLDLDRQGLCNSAPADGVPCDRGRARQHIETARHGARPNHASTRHPDRGDRGDARAWDHRPLHRANHSVGGLGADGGLDPHRSCRAGAGSGRRALT
jgi:predicted PurR-regulated permease PerM